MNSLVRTPKDSDQAIVVAAQYPGELFKEEKKNILDLRKQVKTILIGLNSKTVDETDTAHYELLQTYTTMKGNIKNALGWIRVANNEGTPFPLVVAENIETLNKLWKDLASETLPL